MNILKYIFGIPIKRTLHLAIKIIIAMQIFVGTVQTVQIVPCETPLVVPIVLYLLAKN